MRDRGAESFAVLLVFTEEGDSALSSILVLLGGLLGCAAVFLLAPHNCLILLNLGSLSLCQIQYTIIKFKIKIKNGLTAFACLVG